FPYTPLFRSTGAVAVQQPGHSRVLDSSGVGDSPPSDTEVHEGSGVSAGRSGIDEGLPPAVGDLSGSVPLVGGTRLSARPASAFMHSAVPCVRAVWTHWIAPCSWRRRWIAAQVNTRGEKSARYLVLQGTQWAIHSFWTGSRRIDPCGLRDVIGFPCF